MIKEKKDLKKKSEEIGIIGLNSISHLEAEIMQIVWDKSKISVREVHEIMLKKEMEKKEQGFIPYTTVMSTMATLASKGFLNQDKSAKTYIYSAAVDRKELSKSIITSIVEKLLDDRFKKEIIHFMENEKNMTKKSIDNMLKNF